LQFAVLLAAEAGFAQDGGGEERLGVAIDVADPRSGGRFRLAV
jgi:hypothetical protein